MEFSFLPLVRQKILDAQAAPLPRLTARDVWLPAVPGKALAVIGMRRAGKTSFLWQQLASRHASGTPREGWLYVRFEDERLAGMRTADLDLLVEEYFNLHPEWRNGRRSTLFLDEIQLVSGWELFVRRLLDTENIELFVSGSSAKLLSREVATSMRGLALETVVLHELRRRGAAVDYVLTPGGFEVDFCARWPEGRVWLGQVCADLSDATTLAREVRALQDARSLWPGARAMLVALSAPAVLSLPADIELHRASTWLLEAEPT